MTGTGKVGRERGRIIWKGNKELRVKGKEGVEGRGSEKEGVTRTGKREKGKGEGSFGRRMKR